MNPAPSDRRTFLKQIAGGVAAGSLLPQYSTVRADDRSDPQAVSRELAALPAIDCHVHVYHDGLVEGFLAGMDDAGIERSALLSVLLPGLGTLNANTLAVKSAAPERLYAFCSIDYRGMTQPGWSDRAIAKLQTCLDAGADGIKMLLGKPGNAIAHFPLTHPRMQPLYEWFSEKRLPVIYHVGDVPHFWDRATLNEWSTSPEWTGMYAKYPNACLSPEQIQQQVEEMVTQHPDTKFIFAHLAMPHDDLRWLSRLMSEHANVHADLSASCTVGVLVRQPDKSRAFLERHADRLCFGTDAIMMHTVSSKGCREKYAAMARSARDVFETDGEMDAFFSRPYPGLGLSRPTLRKILRDNFQRLAGDPKPMGNPEALQTVCDEAIRDLHALEGVTSDNEFAKLSEQSLAKRQRDFEEHGTIDNTVYEGGTIPESFRSISLEMFERLRRGSEAPKGPGARGTGGTP